MIEFALSALASTALTHSPPTMHVPVPRPEPQTCTLDWPAAALDRPTVTCPDLDGLPAAAQARLDLIDLPDITSAHRAPSITFEFQSYGSQWKPASAALIWPQPNYPSVALEGDDEARCSIGGKPDPSGILREVRVACVSGYDPGHEVHQAFLREAERFAGQVRILSDARERCHVLPLRFQLEELRTERPAPAQSDVCPQE